MKHVLLITAVLGTLYLGGCDKPTVVNVPATPAATPGPAGPAGPAGATGKPGETVVVIPQPASPAASPPTN